MERFLVIANWKANLPPAFSNFKFQISNSVEVAIAAPYPFISSIPDGFVRASQDVSVYPLGAYTGETPAQLLASLKVKYCLVGHSERRKFMGETNAQVEAKMREAIKAGLTPILCAQNVDEIPANIRNLPPEKFLIMYEPFSAISTDGQYHSEPAERVAATLVDWQAKLNLNCRFLYGGSVNEENCKLIIENCKLVSGFVVGHASRQQTTFFAIIEKCSRV